MIARIASKLIKLNHLRVVHQFSNDDFKDKDKDRKGVFFGKKNLPSKSPVSSHQQENKYATQTPSKTVKFLKRNELKPKQSENNRKEPKAKRQSQQKNQQKYVPFVVPEVQQDGQQFSKKSIFFSRNKEDNQHQKVQQVKQEPQPQIIQLNITHSPQNKFYDTLTQQLDTLMATFEGRQWQNVNNIIEKYLTLAKIEEIQKQIHPLFISKNVLNYLEWINKNNKQYKDLSNLLLKKIYDELLKHSHLSKLKNLLNHLKSNPINLNYQSIDVLFSDIDPKDDFIILQNKINDKIPIARQILTVQLKFNDKVRANKESVTRSYLGEWFFKLGKIVFTKHICKAEYIELFQEIIFKHSLTINLEKLYSNTLFIQTIEKCYFDTHISTTKLFLLFENALNSKEWIDVIANLRRSIILHITKTGSFPFPSTLQLQKELQRSVGKNKQRHAFFYFILSHYNGQPKAYQYLVTKGQQLFKASKIHAKLEDIIDDGLFNINKELLKSEEFVSQTQRTTDKIFKKLKIKKSQTYLNNLKEQLKVQYNPNRSKLLKTIINNEYSLNSVKAAIKLGKYELAYSLCQKDLMEDLILERTTKNIQFAVTSFILQQFKGQSKIGVYEALELIGLAIRKFDKTFIKSIYDRCENFDELIWNYIPKRNIRHQYWETNLTLERADQLLKLDASNKLKDMKYQPEFQTVPEREKDRYISNNKTTWRTKLMAELGIIFPKRDIYNFPEHQTQILKDKSDIKNLIFSQIYDAEEIEQMKKSYPQSQQATQIVQGEQVVQGEQAIQSIQSVEASGEQVQQGSQQAQALKQGEQDQEIQATQQLEQLAEQVQAAQAQTIQQATEVKPTKKKWEVRAPHVIVQQQLQQKQQNHFSKSQKLRVKGYDFTSFIQMARSQLKPLFEEQYETQKEFIKHSINLESLAEQARILDNNHLEDKLFEYQQSVKSPQNIAIFNAYGLWSFDFTSVDEPKEYLWRTDEFRMRYFQFKQYRGKKGFEDEIILNNEKQILTQKYDVIVSRAVSQVLVEDLLLKKHKYFKQAEAVIKLRPSNQVEQLILWGLYNDEPMGIYLGQKIAMLTNQVISHPIALRVSQYLSHRKQIPAERVQRCKDCLKVVGRINREHIYDFSKDYQHITVRKNFQKFIEKRQKELNSTALQFMMRVQPTHSYQEDNFNHKNNIRRGNLVI